MLYSIMLQQLDLLLSEWKTRLVQRVQTTQGIFLSISAGARLRAEIWQELISLCIYMCLHTGLAGITECEPVQVSRRRGASGELFLRAVPTQLKQQHQGVRQGLKHHIQDPALMSSLNIISLSLSPYRSKHTLPSRSIF